jgi:hypothetical protein
MGLIYLDSMDHYGTLQATGKWTSGDFNDAGVLPPSYVEATGGRQGSQAITNDRSGNDSTVGVSPSGGEWIQIGMAYQTDVGSDDDIIKISDVASSGVYMLVLKRNLNGGFRIRNGSNDTFGTTLGNSRARLWHSNEWVYIEFRARIHASLGECYLYVNGKKEIGLTGQDTIGTGPATPIGRVEIRADGWMDDLYICETGGSDAELDASNDSSPGDCHVEALIAVAGNGNYTAWTPASGVDHGAMVDDPMDPDPEPTDRRTDWPDGATTVNTSATVGQKDSYNHDTIAQTTHTKIWGVQLNSWMAKDAIGNREVTPFVRMSSTDYSGTAEALATSYLDYLTIWQRRPSDSAAWTIADIDAAEFGVEVTT